MLFRSGKGLTLAQIGIDTAAAISALTRNSEANPANAVTGGIAGTIQFAAGIVKILANIAKAKQILSQSNAPGMKGGGSSGGSVSAPSAPLPPQLQTTTLNQSQIHPYWKTHGWWLYLNHRHVEHIQ